MQDPEKKPSGDWKVLVIFLSFLGGVIVLHLLTQG